MKDIKKIEGKAQQRKMELERRKKTTKTVISATILITAGVVLGVFFMLNNHDASNIKGIAQNEPVIPVSGISTDATFYTYNVDGTTVRYFAVKGSDDKIHVALDTCDVCYAEKKGYKQIDTVMRCNNCGNQFPINSIGTENTAGGCWPSYLPAEITEGNIILKLSDLSSKSYMFQ